TNFAGETPTLYRNEGDAYFEDRTYAGGLGAHNSFVGWGVGFVDVDQDGWKDILMANGHIYPELARANVGEDFLQKRLVYWNLRNGVFREITGSSGAAITTPQVSRGVAFGDVDGDGALEV